jgi:hypothetical protein
MLQRQVGKHLVCNFLDDIGGVCQQECAYNGGWANSDNASPSLSSVALAALGKAINKRQQACMHAS